MNVYEVTFDVASSGNKKVVVCANSCSEAEYKTLTFGKEEVYIVKIELIYDNITL
jgi:hypothetical protein